MSSLGMLHCPDDPEAPCGPPDTVPPCRICVNAVATGACDRCHDGAYCSSTCFAASRHATTCAWRDTALASAAPLGAYSDALPGNMARQYAETLARDGVVVVPIYDTVAEAAQNRRDMADTLARFPEYLRPGTTPLRYVKSTFGALGNAGSFHNRFVRRVRQQLLLKTVPVMRELRALEAAALGDPRRTATRQLEQLVDRMRVFIGKDAPTAESWHRDMTPDAFTMAGDSIFGGWINLDAPGAPAQRFSCFRQSHRLDPFNGWAAMPPTRARTSSKGFSTFSPAQQRELDALKDAQDRVNHNFLARNQGAALPPNRYDSVLIPPGHMLVFYQEIVHEVLSTRNTTGTDSYRLFTAWRLTDDAQPFAPTNAPEYFRNLEVPHLKSNQRPPMWSVFGNWRPQAVAGLEKWSKETFHPALLVDMPNLYDGDPQGRAPIRVVRIPPYMPSLGEVAVRTGTPVDAHEYPPYTPAELEIYRPTDQWTIEGRRVQL